MQFSKLILTGFVLTAALSAAAFAGICDYRPSSLIGGGTSGAAIGGSSAVALTGSAMQVTGTYLITNATTGAVMVGSTLPGGSAAGTVGIVAGTGGGVGATLGLISAPAVAVAAGATAVVGAGMEGGCYFADDRITDFNQVHIIVQQAVRNAPPDQMGITYKSDGPVLWIREVSGEISGYSILNLYVVNGELYNRDWGLNTDIGPVPAKARD